MGGFIPGARETPSFLLEDRLVWIGETFQEPATFSLDCGVEYLTARNHGSEKILKAHRG